jgi:hypothetical protein
MKRQYADQGLKIILVDESYLTKPNAQTNKSLSNFIYDHELEDIPIINDNMNLNIAAKYGVTIVPSTLLLSVDGTIRQKWENMALPAQLAFAIADVLKK